jgi:hypothetical protein
VKLPYDPKRSVRLLFAGALVLGRSLFACQHSIWGELRALQEYLLTGLSEKLSLAGTGPALPIIPGACNQPHAGTIAAGQNAEPVMLDFVQPTRAGRWNLRWRWQTRLNYPQPWPVVIG